MRRADWLKLLAVLGVFALWQLRGPGHKDAPLLEEGTREQPADDAEPMLAGADAPVAGDSPGERAGPEASDEVEASDGGAAATTARAAVLGGRVVDDGGAPVARARVLVMVPNAQGELTVSERSRRTGSDGRFALARELVERAALLRVVHGAYVASEVQPADVLDGPVEVRLEKGPFVDVRVERSPALTPQHATKLRVQSVGRPQSARGTAVGDRRLFQTARVQVGEIEERVHVGTYGPIVITATQPGAVSEPSEVRLARPEGRARFVLHRSTRIDARAVGDISGDPIPGTVRLTLFRAGQAAPVVGSSQRGDEGRVSLGAPTTGLGPGTYAVKVDVAGYESAWARGIRLEGYGATRDVDVRMKRTQQQGMRVRVPRGAELARWSRLVVWVRGSEPRWILLRPDMEASQGDELVLPDAPVGALDVCVVRLNTGRSDLSRPSEAPPAFARASVTVLEGATSVLVLNWQPGRILTLRPLAPEAARFLDLAVRERDGGDWPHVMVTDGGWGTVRGRTIAPSARLGVFPLTPLVVRFRQVGSAALEQHAIPAAPVTEPVARSSRDN